MNIKQNTNKQNKVIDESKSQLELEPSLVVQSLNYNKQQNKTQNQDILIQIQNQSNKSSTIKILLIAIIVFIIIAGLVVTIIFSLKKQQEQSDPNHYSFIKRIALNNNNNIQIQMKFIKNNQKQTNLFMVTSINQTCKTKIQKINVNNQTQIFECDKQLINLTDAQFVDFNGQLDFDLNQTQMINNSINLQPQTNAINNQKERLLSTQTWSIKKGCGIVNCKNKYSWTKICYPRISKYSFSWKCKKVVLWTIKICQCDRICTECGNTCTNNNCQCTKQNHQCPNLMYNVDKCTDQNICLEPTKCGCYVGKP